MNKIRQVNANVFNITYTQKTFYIGITITKIIILNVGI